MTSAFETTTPDSVAYLDRLAATDLGRDYKGRMLALLDVRPGQTVLDLGCGPGTDLGALAGAVGGDDGRVIGVDRDPHMAARARDGPPARTGRSRVARVTGLSAWPPNGRASPPPPARSGRTRATRHRMTLPPSWAWRPSWTASRPG